MSHQEIIDQFIKEIRIYGINRLPVFAVIANAMVYKCVRPEDGNRTLEIRGFANHREMETICTLNLV